MTNIHQIFATALGLIEPWFVESVKFVEPDRKLIIRVDFQRGARFPHKDHEGTHPIHDTRTKCYRHLNFFQYKCEVVARVPRVRLPDGRVALVTTPWTGQVSGFTALFEALVIVMSREMPFAAVARLNKVSPHRVQAICNHYVELASAEDDQGAVRAVTIDETSRARGHDYVTVAADARKRRVLFVGEGRGADTVGQFARNLVMRGGAPEAIQFVSIDMSPAFIKGVAKHLPHARITFDKFHVVAHASRALDETRRLEQRVEPGIKGMRGPVRNFVC